MLELSDGLQVHVERGPDWLFIRLSPAADGSCDYTKLAEHLWSILDQHFVYRVVLEMEEVPFMPSGMIGQLVMLHRRVANHRGVMRLCGLSTSNRQVLQSSRLDSCFPNYRDREEAVWGYRPAQPR